jgi:cytochrome c-type biogenesis protein CcmH/NrfF
VTGVALRSLFLVLALLVATPASAAPTQQEVEESLTCQCGCGLTVHACNHIQCGSGEPIKKEIAERLARGESKEQILAAFTQKFGEKVLSSPTFSGFNWFAWVTPFAALLLAATILTLAIRKRANATAAVLAPTRPDRGSPPPSDALRARLARELDDLERDS